MKPIGVIRVASDLGAGRKGAAAGPEAIVNAGLFRQLKSIGVEAKEVGTIEPDAADTNAPHTHSSSSSNAHGRMAEQLDPSELDGSSVAGSGYRPAGTGLKERTSIQMKHLDGIVHVNNRLAEMVSALVEQGNMPLVLGGDHSLSIGTLAGLSDHYDDLGVIWVDAHADLNTAETSPSGNIHGMPLAAALGRGHEKLISIHRAGPKIRADRLVIVAARQLDEGERELIRDAGIRCFTMHDIDRDGISRVMEQAYAVVAGANDGVHVSFDIDSVDPTEAPGTGTPVRGGLQYREAHYVMEYMHETGRVVSAELVEVNPLLDTHNRTPLLAVELIASLLGKKIL